MTEKINLGELEKKAWTAYFQDGLWDLFIATMMLTMVIRTLADNVWFTLLMFTGVFIMVLGKKFITIPRLGHVKFGQARMRRQMKLMASIGIAVIATFCLLILINLGWESPKVVTSVGIAVFLALTFGLIAYFLDFPRLFIYGLMFATGEILWGYFGEPTGPYLMLIFGGTVLVIGLIILLSFLRKYPVYIEEAINAH